MTEPTIPPLPEPLYISMLAHSSEREFTADQMRSFYAQGYAKALEAAEKAVHARVMGDNNREDAEALRCLEAIRALPRVAGE